MRLIMVSLQWLEADLDLEVSAVSGVFLDLHGRWYTVHEKVDLGEVRVFQVQLETVLFLRVSWRANGDEGWWQISPVVQVVSYGRPELNVTSF